MVLRPDLIPCNITPEDMDIIRHALMGAEYEVKKDIERTDDEIEKIRAGTVTTMSEDTMQAVRKLSVRNLGEVEDAQKRIALCIADLPKFG